MYEDLGYPWSKFQAFLEKEQVAAMQSLHIETGFPIFIYWKIIHFVRQRCVHGQALLDWPFGVGQQAANPQGEQKLNTKAIFISQFVKHTRVGQKRN